MNSVSLFILPGGDVECLYSELIDLAALGKLAITRATSIEFDASIQRWRVLNGAGKSLFESASREECVQFEHRHFSRRRNLL